MSATPLAADGGKTKSELLAAKPFSAWQVLLTEGGLADLPRQGRGQTITGRRQIGCDRTPREYLASFPVGEVGWTPEAYVLAFWTQLERAGRPLDIRTHTYLTASYLPASGHVPYADWYPGDRQAHLVRYLPGGSSPCGGGRAAVRVI